MKLFKNYKENKTKEKIRNIEGGGDLNYKRDFIDIDKAQKIGLIVNMNQCTNEDLELIRNYIEALLAKGKKLLVIELNFLKKSTPALSGAFENVFISPSHLTWLDYPTKGVEKQIQKHDLDILIDLDYSERMTAKYVCSIAKAKTRTGMHVEGFEGCYELMVKPQNPVGEGIPYSMKTMIKEFDYFLNMIGY